MLALQGSAPPPQFWGTGKCHSPKSG
ncbi:MAG: hypothetical protein JWQ02_22, partial [Capsulimonas sp.]|nr:hypothetical protein [Capsulimonas sp.]